MDIADSVQTTFVRHGKIVACDPRSKTRKSLEYQFLILVTAQCTESLIAKAAAAQEDRLTEPNYPAAYAVSELDRSSAGLGTAHLPSVVPTGAKFVTSAGSPFDPADPDLRIMFRYVWQTPTNLISKAQTFLLNIIREHFQDGLIVFLNKTFPGSDLLQKYWL